MSQDFPEPYSLIILLFHKVLLGFHGLFLDLLLSCSSEGLLHNEGLKPTKPGPNTLTTH